MNAEDFQLLDETLFENSIIKRGSSKLYLGKRADLIYSDKNIDFIFGKGNNYYQIANAYLQFELTSIKTMVNCKMIIQVSIDY